MGIVLDAGADDLRQHCGIFDVICEPTNFNPVQEALAAKGLTPVHAEITQLAKTSVDVPDMELAMRVVKLMEAIDDHDDVQNVYSNMHMSDEIMAELGKE
jgi:transcriptional/translational regulatory protein YebC/TACO1